jgi:hypothetical protein
MSEPGGVVVQTEGGDPEPVDVMRRGRDVGPWAPLGWDCHFLPSAQARPGGDGASSGVIDQTNFGLSFGPRVFPSHPQLLC